MDDETDKPRWRQIRDGTLVAGLLLAIAAVWIVGLITLIRWAFS